METQPPQPPQKITFRCTDNSRQVQISSDFDGGNLARVDKQGTLCYYLSLGADCEGMEVEGYSRSWFYFSVEGFSDAKVLFVINRVQVLWALLRFPEKYRPVYKTEQQPWRRLPTAIRGISVKGDNEIVLSFDFQFPRGDGKTYFAFTYPYTYSQLQERLMRLQQTHEGRKEYLFKRSLLIKSSEGRNIDLLMISSHDYRDGQEPIKDLQILQDTQLERFRNTKPIILITARVHPLETPSSYVMDGIMDFLLSLDDPRAFILRQNFVFVMVPMLNPDGVFRGHCRMDSYNQNLNRYYNTPDLEKQPSCYAVRKLAEHYTADKRLFFYLDLHAHPANKGNFVFGNAVFDYVTHVESALFPRLLSENCANFQFQQCNFSRKQMTAKDRNEDLNKEGCGRVVLYKEFGIVHAYTLECGYHSNTAEKQLPEIPNKNLKFKLRCKESNGLYTYDLKPLEGVEGEQAIGIQEQELDDTDNDHYKQGVPFYTTNVFSNLGKNLMVTLLDIWNKNPYPRVEDPNSLRKELASQNRKLDRFRREQSHLKTKEQNIVQLIEENFYATWRKRIACVDKRKKISSLISTKRASTLTKESDSRSIYYRDKPTKVSTATKFRASSEKEVLVITQYNREKDKDRDRDRDRDKDRDKDKDKDKEMNKELSCRPLRPKDVEDGSVFMKYSYKFRISKKF